MKVFPGIFILLAVSSASAFDFSSVLNSVLKTVLDTSKFENNVSYEDNNDIIINRTPSAFELGKCEVDEDECEYHQASREQQRIKDARRKIQEAEVYTCILDTPGYRYSPVMYDAPDTDAASAEDEIIALDDSDYYSDKYLNAQYQCNQRLKVIDSKANEKKRQEEAERRAKIPKKPEAKIGMTKDQVKKSRWGNPTHLHTTTNSKGTYEKWGYYIGTMHRGTLYFTNGKLTSIEKSGSH